MTKSPAVWIVDDDEDDQYLIEEAFKWLSPPIDVKVLSDGDELIPCLKLISTPPKLVLLDLNMRRQSGFETLEELRAIPAYEDLPVVILTTSDSPMDIEKSFALGANGMLTKPPQVKELRQLVGQLNLDWHLD